MKRILALCIALALAAPLVFSANIQIGGRAIGVAQVIGNSEKGVGTSGKDPWTRWTDDLRLDFTLNNDTGTAGAAFRLTGSVWDQPPSWWTSTSQPYYFGVNWFQAWWQPIKQIYFSVGKIEETRRYNPEPLKLSWSIINTDSWDMKAIQFAPWDPYQGIGPVNDNIYIDLKATGDKIGMQFSYVPTDDLNVTFVWSGFDYNQTFTATALPAKQVLLDELSASVSYTTPIGGQATLTFANAAEGGTRRFGFMYTQQITNPLYAEITALLPFPNDNGSFGKMQFVGGGLGLGYQFSDKFNLNARAAGEFGLTQAIYNASGTLLSGHATKIGFDLVPTYKIDWSLVIYLPVGYARDVAAKLNGWSFCPYFMKDTGWVTFYGGFKIWGDNSTDFKKSNGDPSVSWAVPVGLMLNF